MQIPLPPSPPPSTASVSASMKGNRAERTRPESKLRQELRRAGLHGFLMNYKKLPGTPDIAFPNKRLAIFLHGCFWHRCPYCHPHFPESNRAYWTAKFERNRFRDRKVRAAIRQAGWTTMVIWECKLKKNPAKAVLRIQRMVEMKDGKS